MFGSQPALFRDPRGGVSLSSGPFLSSFCNADGASLSIEILLASSPEESRLEK